VFPYLANDTFNLSTFVDKLISLLTDYAILVFVVYTFEYIILILLLTIGTVPFINELI